MIPIGDTNRTGLFPIAVYAIVAVNVAVFIKELAVPNVDAFIDGLALIPYNVGHAIQLDPPAVPTLATLLTSQFLHGGFLHIFFNMLFLVVFGPGVEQITGHLRFLAFYLICGVIGGLTQIATTPNSHIPSVGASGAIAGVLGAYILSFPTNSIRTVVPIGCFPVLLRLPAALIIGLWAIAQFVHGYGAISTRVLSEQGGGVAYFAHIGGFLAGVFLIGLFRMREPGPPRLRYRS
jgi:membrane associated rhomboid family serine protease